MDVVGAGIYAFLNRLLIPTGLHHALNNVFWFDTIGLGDLQHFWAGETSADVTWSLGMYMSGFFPCMMFGIPGAALAMVKCAKPDKEKSWQSDLIASAALCAFICGVTEPFEFGFMFLAPATVRNLCITLWYLYDDYSCTWFSCRIQFLRRCYGFDLLILPSGSTEDMAYSFHWELQHLSYSMWYSCFAIKKFDLKTPGREDDDD